MSTRFVVALTGVALALTPAGTAAQAGPASLPAESRPVSIPMVRVGNPGNAPDPATGFGAVAQPFRIAKFDVTIAQYTAFLNAVARREDKHQLYNPLMESDHTVAGIRRVFRDGLYRYRVMQPQGAIQSPAATAGNRPITYVSWFDAARFANWMSNGQPRGRQNRLTTEVGAYDLTQQAAKEGNAVPVSAINPHTGKAPAFTVPTENQWYKAAYYSPSLNDGSGGYYLYASRTSAPPGNSLDDTPGQANYLWAGLMTVTRQAGLDLQQNYLTDVGSFTGSPGAFGTFDMNGNVWEWNDGDGLPSAARISRGGGWTSYYTYLQSTTRLGSAPASQSSNAGFRLASTLAPSDSPFYELVQVGAPGNEPDVTGYGSVASTYSIGKYEVTIGEYADFLNAVATTDTFGLYDPNMSSARNSAGIARTGESGSYAYAPVDNMGDSTNRPITYVSWFDVARFANWMSNGRPEGAQDSTTTEDGAYTLNGAIRGSAVGQNAFNPNTGLAPTFTVPTEDQWYKAAYYSPSLNAGSGGYYLYATQSNIGPDNQIGSEPNQVNYINDYNGSNTYAVTQVEAIDSSQNYLTDVGYFRKTPSYYGAYDLNGNVYQWNDLDGRTSVVRGWRGGFWFAGPPSLQSLTFNEAGVTREANDTGFRLAAP